jgi:hypothetical protein
MCENGCEWGEIDESIPPIYACTPYQIIAITTRLITGQKDPQIPNEARAVTGKEI